MYTYIIRWQVSSNDPGKPDRFWLVLGDDEDGAIQNFQKLNEDYGEDGDDLYAKKMPLLKEGDLLEISSLFQ